MGTGKSGLYRNTKGASNTTKENLIGQLEKSGIKFSKKDMVFITKDRSGQIVWLEKGNSGAGLKHILDGNGTTKGHANDFQKAFGVSKSDIPSYLEKVVTHGKIVKSELKMIGKRPGYERIYYYNGKYHMLTSIGTNGFIVTAYPVKY